ncbi:MAG: PilZ domain-containing protein [Desulfobacterales bacterium]|nr:PilZ domain-containing protein [Desulfobacterales bacterium]
MIKAFINIENKATFVCPQCNKTKVADVSKYKDIDQPIWVNCKCPCGHTYKVLLERRRHFRKEVNLKGRYIWGDKGGGSLLVKDLSRSGIKFMVNFPPKFSSGDLITVEFTLDNQASSIVRKDVIVKNINKLIVGAEFTTQDHYDFLGGYFLT